ncbi:hypothetical protein [Agrococcus sp. TF02-05]|uniref:hypothetical protein n=1 Tax=Agrococcus sp. TF02-05 TaxID=2815211 RepID=UPI001AA15EB5|nr:hypothetical protein [Agrococcus sp. TF02-05]MBO1770900.1 hypothetical protein [Agrococcus sp. TF02-05]
MTAHPARDRALVAALGALLLTGCAAGAQAEPSALATPHADPAASAAPVASASPTASGDARAVDTGDWLAFATERGSVSFRCPPRWTLEAESELFAPDAERTDVQVPHERWMDSATLTALNGQQLLAMHDFVDIGGGPCGELRPLEVLAVEPSLWTIDSLDDAGSYMETDEYATIVEILGSYRT